MSTEVLVSEFGDDEIINILASEARNYTVRNSPTRATAYGSPVKMRDNIKKPNTRFLRHVIKDTEYHNATLKVRETFTPSLRSGDIFRAGNDRVYRCRPPYPLITNHQSSPPSSGDEFKWSRRSRQLSPSRGSAELDDTCRNNHRRRRGRAWDAVEFASTLGPQCRLRSRSPDRIYDKELRLSLRCVQLDRGTYHDAVDNFSGKMIGPMPQPKIRGRGSGSGSSTLDKMFSEVEDLASSSGSATIDRGLNQAFTVVSRDTDDGQISWQRSPHERNRPHFAESEPLFKIGTNCNISGPDNEPVWSGAGLIREWDQGKSSDFP